MIKSIKRCVRKSCDNIHTNKFDLLEELNELFSRFKADPNDDFINVNRLTEVLQAFGRNPSLRDSEERINELEMAGKKIFLLSDLHSIIILFFYLKDKFELTLDDFLQILDEQWTMANNNRDILRQAFGKFDETQEGYIDIERFRTIMSTLGEPLTDEELEEFIQLGLNEDQTKVNIECKRLNVLFRIFEHHFFFFRFTRSIIW
jgi:calmodulin